MNHPFGRSSSSLRFLYLGVLTCSLPLTVFLPGCGSSDSKVVSQATNVKSNDASGTTVETDATANREAYDSFEENPFFNSLSQPQSTFSIDVDTASYSNVRRLIREGVRPPKGAVRLEEFVNYFPYDYAEPVNEHPLAVSTEIVPCPWNRKNQLLRVALKGRSENADHRKQCNLVFLIDVSGSMNSAEKLPLVKASLEMLMKELKPTDRIAIVVYAAASGVVLPSTLVENSAAILDSLNQLNAGGSTNGGVGIELAYKIAHENHIEGGVNRVILCTDGDFNVGATSDSALVELVQEKAKQKTFLTVLGFGKGNLQDSKMEKLADKGNGNYGYIDSTLEARKVLVEQARGTLNAIASDVKIQLDFNPKHVSEYRLLGYENRKLENKDFRNDEKDAGEIGAGHNVTAFYELVPTVDQPTTTGERASEFVDQKPSLNAESETLLTVNLRYKEPDGVVGKEFQVRVEKHQVSNQPSTDFAFASSVIAYGMLLRQSKYAGDASWNWVVDTAQQNMGKDPLGLRSEFVQLAKTASKLVHN